MLRGTITAVILFASLPALAQDGLVLNEIVSSNVTGLPDEYEEDLQNCPVPDCLQWFKDLGRSIYDGEYPDWIELYNGTGAVLNLAGYTLSDRDDAPNPWTFPDIEMSPGEYLVVFASGKNKHEDYLHTDFRISRTGEPIVLLAPDGSLVDRVNTGELPVDYALARSPENPEEWIIVDSPTPGEPNQGVAFTGFTDAVTASPPAGFHERFPSVTLACSNPMAEIRYTLDGNVPTVDSSLYNRPITALFGGDRVIRARCFLDGRPASPVLTQSYITERTFNMPVVSLSTAPDHLWDDALGIYTPGKNAREGDRVANYWNDWERPVHVEFFEPDGTLGFTADAGLRIFGWGSRSDPQKSVSLMFRGRYGMDELQYPVFPDEEVTSFTALVLRAAGSDSRSNGTFFRDPFATGLLKGRNVDIQAFRPAVVYLNGEYWGIQNIREKMNEDYLASHHHVDRDELDIISRYWRRRHPVVIEGDSDQFLAFESFLESNDLSHDDAYQEALQWIDLDNFLEYSAAQIFFANFDWPGNNNKNWKPRTMEGRWRWLMYDLDYAMGFTNEASFSFDTLAHAMAPGGTGWPNPGWTTLILRKFAENEAFRHAFANRIADLANTVLSADRALARLEDLQAHYAPEMEHHIDRWRREGDSISSLSAWENNIATVRTFFLRRPEFILGHVRNHFELGDPTPLKLELDEGAGKVKVNSVTVEDPMWTGNYFLGVPITLTAIPRPGHRFVRWDGLAASPTEPVITVDPSMLEGPLQLVFESAPEAVNAIRFHEINYHSHPDHDAGDWVELVNAYEQAIDLSGWVFQDSVNSHRFVIPQGTVIGPGGFLVLCENDELFSSVHPAVPCGGTFAFGLSNGGERLRLYDSEGRVIDEVTYDDEAPWPTEPDGTGATLALTDPATTVWAASLDKLGTPGSANGFIPAQGQPSLGVTIRLDGEWIILENLPEDPLQFQQSGDLESWSDWEPEISEQGDLIRIARPPKAPAGYFRLRK